ncbi:hypothetical protein BDY19DRAFT_405215 [Irpex rosettiformis]|uniref:Uncharacterized protein n=1 Tax=Irpex rosettiformis TaxID=378272 RepID=A0ACB8UFC7_9APHY|nr:hypothetical protein BDY19DRAFT_405215 [Irpex rosettiformis]
MSTAESASRKKRSSEPAKRTSEDDHRRKRRNRTTQSCLNCHTSKRMCDRKRPCGRCTQLGLTGLCVYEVDDPSQQPDASDEKARLQKRVAELESVIRELKNKPHPRWAQTLDKAKLRLVADSNSVPTSPPRSSSEESEDPVNSSPRIRLHPPTPSSSTGSSPLLAAGSSKSSATMSPHFAPSPSASSNSSSLGSPPPTDAPSPLSLSPVDGAPEGGYDFASLLSTVYHDGAGLDGNLDNLLDGLMRGENLSLPHSDPCLMHHDRGHCGCLSDSTSYGVVLELSLRLRRAAEVLSHDVKHRASPNCPIHQRIADLDRRASEALANVNTTTPTFSPFGPQSNFAPPLPQASASRQNNVAVTVAPHSLHASVRSWDFKSTNSYPSPPCEDSFMSWEPSRRSSDWAQSSGL